MIAFYFLQKNLRCRLIGTHSYCNIFLFVLYLKTNTCSHLRNANEIENAVFAIFDNRA